MNEEERIKLQENYFWLGFVVGCFVVFLIGVSFGAILK